MRVVVQRVKQADVSVEGEVVSKIETGLLVFLGIEKTDTKQDADYLVDKIINLRIFEDDNHKMNLSLIDTASQVLVVSQFTLYGDCRKGRRPSFDSAASAGQAEKLYRYFVDRISSYGIDTKEGRFRAMMEVSLVNYGPVTFIIDSR